MNFRQTEKRQLKCTSTTPAGSHFRQSWNNSPADNVLRICRFLKRPAGEMRIRNWPRDDFTGYYGSRCKHGLVKWMLLNLSIPTSTDFAARLRFFRSVRATIRWQLISHEISCKFLHKVSYKISQKISLKFCTKFCTMLLPNFVPIIGISSRKFLITAKKNKITLATRTFPLGLDSRISYVKGYVLRTWRFHWQKQMKRTERGRRGLGREEN